MLDSKKIALIFVIIVSILSTGCWNYREIEKLAIVAGASVDKNLSTGTYEVSVEIINPTSSKSQTKITSQLYSSEGKTVFDAIRNLILSTGKNLFWSHCKVVIVSDSIASEGIAHVLDWFNRDLEVRPNMWLLITKTGSASSILTSKAVKDDLISFHLDEIMKSQNPIYKFPQMDVWRFRRLLSSKTGTAVAPTVKQEMKHEKASLQIYGTEVFKGDKAIDEIGGSTDFINGSRNRKLEEDAEKALKKELESVVERVQKDYKSDIFDFGGAIKRRYPRLWKKIEPNYLETFSKLHVNVNVDLTIKGSARVSKPIEIGE